MGYFSASFIVSRRISTKNAVKQSFKGKKSEKDGETMKHRISSYKERSPRPSSGLEAVSAAEPCGD
jgi:hypothetical protein